MKWTKKLILLIITSIALTINMVYFYSEVDNSNSSEIFTLTVINFFGLISSFIQVIIFLSNDETNSRVKDIHGRMFPLDPERLQEKYKHLTNSPERGKKPWWKFW